MVILASNFFSNSAKVDSMRLFPYATTFTGVNIVNLIISFSISNNCEALNGAIQFFFPDRNFKNAAVTKLVFFSV